MLQDKLVEHLLAKLNTNPRNITFKGGYLLQQTNESFEFTTWTNYYTSTTTEYVPVMFDSTSTPKNIPNKQIYDWTINMVCALDGEVERYDDYDTVTTNLTKQRKALDWFRQELTNSPLDTVVSDSVTYQIITTATDIQLIQDTMVVDGKKRSVVNMQINVQSGIDIWYGNQVTYSLKLDSELATEYLALDLLSSVDAKSKSLDSAQVIGDTSTKSVGIDASYVFKGVVLYKNDDLLNNLVKDILGEQIVNYKYTLKIAYPNITEIEKTVFLSNGSVNTTLGQLVSISVEFVEV